jgi:hypothetical protein
MIRTAADIGGEVEEQGPPQRVRTNDNAPDSKSKLLKLRTFACEGLPPQDILNGKLPYVLGFQKTAEGEEYLAYKSQELHDDVEAPRWNPDMMFHVNVMYALPCSFSTHQ